LKASANSLSAGVGRLALGPGVALVALLSAGCQRSSAVAGPGRTVAIVPFEGLDARSVDVARQALQNMTDARVVVLPVRPLPKSAYYPPRKRHRADKLIDGLGRLPYWHVVGLTHRDISTTKGSHADWGVFGLGSCPGRACVVSTFRMGKPSERRQARLAKVVVHEFGHTLGLPHCPAPKCLMNDARGKAATVDAENSFCDRCSEVVGKGRSARKV
jgi:archaemetzincin